MVCQRAKGENISPPGLLQPIPIPEKNWTDISMDFIKGLPRSQGYEVITVVVDRLSKYAHVLPPAHPYTAASVARNFLDQIFRLHGMPLSVVSDRDPVVTSTFGRNCLSSKELSYSTALLIIHEQMVSPRWLTDV